MQILCLPSTSLNRPDTCFELLTFNEPQTSNFKPQIFFNALNLTGPNNPDSTGAQFAAEKGL